MLFNTYGFILLFIPVVVLLHYLVGKLRKPVASKLLLLGASYAFVAYASPAYLGVLLLSTSANYLINCLIARKPTSGKALCTIGVVFNIALLGWFKYANYLIETINAALGEGVAALPIILPLGISYYTFQQIAYLVDNYRGEVPGYGALDYFLFTAFFPKFVQGPIPYHDELIPQFNDPKRLKLEFNGFASGLMIFAIGLAKKVLVADNIGKIVEYGFNYTTYLNSFMALIVIIGNALRFYFDFSGYSDMAIGAGKMLNIDLPANFDSPFKALDVGDFWRRWHITLMRFLRKYLYIPLGGNRKGSARTSANILIVFVVSGIWHGTGLPFLVWGVLQGLGMIAYRYSRPAYEKLPRLIRWFLTFAFFCITAVLVRATSISNALEVLGRLFAGGFGLTPDLIVELSQQTFISLLVRVLPLNVAVIALFAAALAVVVRADNSNEMLQSFRPTARTLVLGYVLLTLSVLSITGVSAFLYTTF